jgi:hypothetical protein
VVLETLKIKNGSGWTIWSLCVPQEMIYKSESVILFFKFYTIPFRRMDTSSQIPKKTPRNSTKMQALKEDLNGTLSKGIESLIGVQEKRHQENRRLTDSSAYAQVLAQSLCELDPKDEKLVRHALDRIVLNASIGDMSLVWIITGISTNSGMNILKMR